MGGGVVLHDIFFVHLNQNRKQGAWKRRKRAEGGVAQVQLQGVPHVQCPMRPPPQVTPHLRYSNKLDISLPRWTRYSDCSYGPISVYIPDILLHIVLQPISGLYNVQISGWSEVRLDIRSRPRGLVFPRLCLLLSDIAFPTYLSLCCNISRSKVTFGKGCGLQVFAIPIICIANFWSDSAPSKHSYVSWGPPPYVLAQKHSRFLSNSLSSCLLILRRGRPGHLVMAQPTTSGGLPPPSRCRCTAGLNRKLVLEWKKGLREPRIGATPPDKQLSTFCEACLLPQSSFHLPHLAWALIDKSRLSNPRSEAEGEKWDLRGLRRIPSKEQGARSKEQGVRSVPRERSTFAHRHSSMFATVHFSVWKIHGTAFLNICLIKFKAISMIDITQNYQMKTFEDLKVKQATVGSPRC